MKRTPMKRVRDTPRTSKGLFKDLKKEKKGLFPKKESKTKQWNNTREILKERFIKAGIVSCELKWINCTGALFWSFAHAKRRRFINTQEDLENVILACTSCHKMLDYSYSHEETEKIVMSVVELRNVKV